MSRIEHNPYPPENKESSLSEAKMGSLLSSIGNNEAKAVTLLAMKPDIIYTAFMLHKAVNDMQGDIKGWVMAVEGPYRYCEKSFEPIGLVAQEVTDTQENKYGYVKTRYGNEIGDIYAGLMLGISAAHPDVSLHMLFGNTSSPSPGDVDKEGHKKRSPISRLQIFRELLSSPSPARLGEVAQKMQEDDRTLVSRHISYLKDQKIIEYENGEVTIPSKEMKNLLFEVVVKLSSFQYHDPRVMEYGKTQAQYFRSHPVEVSELMKKAYDHSSNAKQVSLEVSALELLNIIQSHPGLTVQQSRILLREEMNRNLSIDRVRRIAQYLEKNGKILRSEGRRNITYRPAS